MIWLHNEHCDPTTLAILQFLFFLLEINFIVFLLSLYKFEFFESKGPHDYYINRIRFHIFIKILNNIYVDHLTYIKFNVHFFIQFEISFFPLDISKIFSSNMRLPIHLDILLFKHRFFHSQTLELPLTLKIISFDITFES